MKKLITVLAIFGTIATAQAQIFPNDPTQVRVCRALGTVAEEVMMRRQMGVPKRDVEKELSREGKGNEMIEWAYSIPIYAGIDKRKERNGAILWFKNKFTLQCLYETY